MCGARGVGYEIEEDIAAEAAGGDVCAAANDNAPGQIVLSGSASAITRAVKIAKENGAKRSIILPVSAPFHCPLMNKATIYHHCASNWPNHADYVEIEKDEMRFGFSHEHLLY